MLGKLVGNSRAALEHELDSVVVTVYIRCPCIGREV